MKPFRTLRTSVNPAALASMLALIVFFASLPAVAQPPVGYYATVDASTPSTLRQTLHNVIDDHTWHPYTSSSQTDTWDIIKVADEDPSNASNIVDVYQNASYGKGDFSWNREHTWPKSYGFPDLVDFNYPYTDVHHLFPSDADYNSARSNKPFRNCNASCAEWATDSTNGRGGGSGVYPGNSNWTSGDFTQGTWEAWNGRKGDVARAIFYMDIRYEGGNHGITGHAEPDLRLTDDEALIDQSRTGSNESSAYMGMLSVLLEWHARDPPDDIERARTDGIFSFQGNRNPFVDHPEWVDCLYGGICGGGGGGGGGGTGDVVLSEVLYDVSSGDDGFEWVELYNPGESTVDLSGFCLANGGTDYTWSQVQLSGTIASGATFVVGGPTSSGTNSNPSLDQGFNFNPDFQNSGSTADGVALFDKPCSQVGAATVPVDAVIYGSNNSNGLLDETGSANAPEVGDASAGTSLERQDLAGNWSIRSFPNPNTTPLPAPGGGGPPPPSCAGTEFTGTISGGENIHDIGSRSGTIVGTLACTSGSADLDLFLEQENCSFFGCSWDVVASSESATCDESVTASGNGSQYRFRVLHWSGGTASYSLCVE